MMSKNPSYGTLALKLPPFKVTFFSHGTLEQLFETNHRLFTAHAEVEETITKMGTQERGISSRIFGIITR